MSKQFSFFDLHVHTTPDTFIRRYTADSLGIELKKTFSGAVLKSHSMVTTGIAYTMRSLGYPIYGSITLNKYVGGIDCNVLQSAIAANGNNQMIIYFPTLTDREHVGKMKQQRAHNILDKFPVQGEAVSCNRVLKEKTKDIIKIAAYYNIPMATGHSSKEDIFLIAEEVEKNKGKLILTHPFHPCVNLNIDDVKELMKYKNIYTEFTILMSVLKYENIRYILELLNEGYEDRICISSDLGQLNNTTVTLGYRWFRNLLKANTISEKVVNKICLQNPMCFINVKSI